MSADKKSDLSIAMTRVGNSNQHPVADPIWTIPTLFTYPAVQNNRSEVYKTGVDNPAYFDNECQGDREQSVSAVVSSSAKLKKQPWLRLWKLSFYKNEKGQQRRALALMVIFVVILLVLVVAIGLAIYLSMRDMGWSWTSQDAKQDENEENWAVAGEFRITNRIYSPELANPSSPQYIRLAAEVLQSLDDMFLQSPLVRDYNTSEIVGFREGSVIASCHIFLNQPTENIAQKIGLIFVRSLEMGHGSLPAGTLRVDIQTIRFVGIRAVTPTLAPTVPTIDASWSQWSGWSSCSDLGGRCDRHRVQSRSRDCRALSGQGNRLPSTLPCQEPGKSGELEVRDCVCNTSDLTTTMRTTEKILTTEAPSPSPTSTRPPNIRQPCNECPNGEVCLLAVGDTAAYCVPEKDPADPRGCGGWCTGRHELCRQLNKTVYECMDVSECLKEEWKCGNGLCVPIKRRCDGHFNCYDMTDEYDCECQPDEFHCGNNTSCLPPEMHCNGYIDCWDGSDELNCTALCPEGMYTCNNGQCIPTSQFCDRLPDCQDKSDEPQGCYENCTSDQHFCSNGRCIAKFALCDGVDNCGDNSDEEKCQKVDSANLAAKPTNLPEVSSTSSSIHSPLNKGGELIFKERTTSSLVDETTKSFTMDVSSVT